MVPSASTRIFKTFLCDPIEYNANLTRRVLQEDLSLDCDSAEYDKTKDSAIVMVALWPVGTPL
eukprot:1604238-Prymnesium_polylepis.1